MIHVPDIFKFSSLGGYRQSICGIFCGSKNAFNWVISIGELNIYKFSFFLCSVHGVVLRQTVIDSGRRKWMHGRVVESKSSRWVGMCRGVRLNF